MGLIVGEHNDLWKSSAKSLTNLDVILTNIKTKLKMLNYRELAKELYELGEISKEDYAQVLKALWNHEEVFGEFDKCFKKTES